MARPTTQDRLDALATYAAGASMKEVARTHRVSESTVHNWVHAAGISRSNGAGKRASAQRRRDQEFGYVGGWEIRGGVRYPLLPERRSA